MPLVDPDSGRWVWPFRRRKPPPRPAEHYSGAYARPGALLRTPGGHTEDIARYLAAGLRWLLWNAEYPVDDWRNQRTRCDALSIPHGPWFHCRQQSHLAHLADLSRGSRIVGFNVEQELLDGSLPPTLVADTIRSLDPGTEACVITLGWTGDVNLAPIATTPLLLEVFPADAEDLWHPTVKTQHCLDRARANGARHPMLLMQCYGKDRPHGWGQPDWYPNLTPRHLYTLDDAVGENGPVERWLT